jgi:serine/threonine protein kinase/TPR repeat protein
MPEDLHRNALTPGHRLHWYTIQRVLGQGGFGVTYLGLDSNLDQPVAIKEFLPWEIAVRGQDLTIQPRSDVEAEQYERWLERFLIEARTLARFDHPNIVRVHSVFEANNTAYLVMRYEEGEALNTILKQRRHLPEEELLGIILPILDGLKRVHELGFVHRDCQPANIFIRRDGSPVLLDFGAARQSVGQARTLTILVAPGYAPIEQYYSSGAEQGPWTDIYGLGATLYRAVAGVAPLDAIERSRGMLGSTRDVLVPARVVGEGRYSAHFLAAIDHALEFNEKDRPQTVTEWAAELRDGTVGGMPEEPKVSRPVVRAAPVEADPETPSSIRQPGSATSWVARPALRWSVAAAIFAAGIAIGALLLESDEGSESAGADARVEPAPGPSEAPIDARRAAAAPSPPAPDAGAPASTAAPQPAVLTVETVEMVDSLSVGAAAAPTAAPEWLPEPASPIDETLAATAEPQVATAPATREALARLQAEVQAEAVKRANLEREIATLHAMQEVERRQATAREEAEQRRLAEERRAARAAEDAAAATSPQPAPTAPSASSAASRSAEAEPDRLAQGLAALANGNHKTAMGILQPLAKDGDPVAQFNVATMYHAGRGVLANNRVALDWMRKAAWQGQSDAQISLARMYLGGIDGVQDPFLAYTWFLVAERNGAYEITVERDQSEKLLQVEQIQQASALAADIQKSKIEAGISKPARN